jgi:hypothetical protein
MTELLGGISEFVTSMGPAVQSGYVPAPLAFRMLAAAARRFKMGREVEEEINQLTGEQVGPDGQVQAPQLPAPPPSPEAQAREAEMAMRQQENAAKGQAEQAKAAAEQEARRQEMALRDRELALQERQHAFAEKQHADQQDLEKLKSAEARAAREEDYDNEERRSQAEALPPNGYEDDMKELAALVQAVLQGQQQQARRTQELIRALTAPKDAGQDGASRLPEVP